MDVLPKRKENRLTSFDYSKSGSYFITICTVNRQPILSLIKLDKKASQASSTLTSLGKIVEDCIVSMQSNSLGHTIDHFVVMPNHVHFLLSLSCDVQTVDIQQIVRYFKGQVTRQAGKAIFQKGFHDHVIRDEEDYQHHWRYIDDNPLRWADDEYCVV